MSNQSISDWKSTVEQHRTVILKQLLAGAVIVGIAGIALLYALLSNNSNTGKLIALAPFVAAWFLLLVAWVWRGLDDRYKAFVLLVVTYGLGVALFALGGLSGGGRMWLLLLPVLAFCLFGFGAGVASGTMSILTCGLFVLAINRGWVNPQIGEGLTDSASLLYQAGSFLVVAMAAMSALRSFHHGWQESLAISSLANRQLQAQSDELKESRERLGRRASQLQATAEITHAVSSMVDLDKLMIDAVHQICGGLGPMGVDHVSLFLLDETQQYAELKAAAGRVGRPSSEADQRMELSEGSAVGWCIVHEKAHMILSMGRDTDSPLALAAPGARSEIALPLRSRGNILGALSIQSGKRTTFEGTDLAVLQMMADQVAVAIDNARLFSETEAALREVQVLDIHSVGPTWKELLAARSISQADYSQPGIESREDHFLSEARQKAAIRGETVATTSGLADDVDGAALVVPLKLREQIIGTIALHETDHQRQWTGDDISMAETIAEQVSLTIDNLRLFEQIQRRATQERLVSEIASRVRASLDPDTILKTTVRELGRVLGAQLTAVEITGPIEARADSLGLEPSWEGEG